MALVIRTEQRLADVMAEFPMLPLWTDAYLADTRHLTTLQHGAYFLMLITAWRDPECSLADNDRKLAQAAGLSVQEWTENRETLLEFWHLENGRWTQKRLSKEMTKTREMKEAAARAGRAGARARWRGNGDPMATLSDRYSDPNAIAMRIDSSPSPSPSPSHKERDSAGHVLSRNVRNNADNVDKNDTHPAGEILELKAEESKRAPRPKKEVRPENFEAMVSFALKNRMTEKDARFCWCKWESNGWTINKQPIKSWKDAMIAWRDGGYLPSTKGLK